MLLFVYINLSIFMKFSEILTFLDRLSLEQRGRRFDSLEREILDITWGNKSYQNITTREYQTVKNKAGQLWKDLSQLLNINISKQNFRGVLEELNISDILSPKLNENTFAKKASPFCGRSIEILKLQQWIELQQVKLIFIYGMKGIGKTWIAENIAKRLSDNLDYIVWIPLKRLTPLIDVLTIIVNRLSERKSTRLSKNTSILIDKAIECFKKNRCLLILDDADEIISQADSDINNPLIADYIKFFVRLNSVEHNSCCLTILDRKVVNSHFNYQELLINGLDWESCQMMLANHELKGSPIDWERLVTKYSGNPQYLKSIVPTIQNIFHGDIARFLDADILLYDRIDRLVAYRLNRLSTEEISVILCMMVKGRAMILEELHDCLKDELGDREFFRILDRLVYHGFIISSDRRFRLCDLVVEYMLDKYNKFTTGSINNAYIYVKTLRLIGNC